MPRTLWRGFLKLMLLMCLAIAAACVIIAVLCEVALHDTRRLSNYYRGHLRA